MSQKQEFVERAARGESIASLSREYGISRQTGHKWVRRFAEAGYDGLEDRSRRPISTPLATAEDIVMAVLAARKKHPTWGPRKLVVIVGRKLGELAPSERTIARILKRADLIRTRRVRRPPNFVERAPQVEASEPNDVWTIDFKGSWLTRDGHRANPLTVRDAFSRFVLAVQLVPATTAEVMRVLESLFKKHGIPSAIQCDNGAPFVSVRSVGGLSQVSAWWMSLGITVVRSRPGTPQDNGGHERMHRDIWNEVERVAADDIPAQQRALDKWKQTFNRVRPHEALNKKTPAEVYRPKERRRAAAPAYTYPLGFSCCRVSNNGNVRLDGSTYFLSVSLGGHHVGIERLSAIKARAWFRDVELCTLDLEPNVSSSVYAEAMNGWNAKRGAAA
jgi:putative transposase